MSYNNYMYAVDRSDEYLAHYGIKGMKWGVRKALERGDRNALSRQYRKASKKLAKLERQANNGKKYARRAARLGAGAAAAGGLAVAGTEGVSKLASGATKLATRGTYQAGTLASKLGGAMQKAGIRGGGRVSAIGNSMKTGALDIARGGQAGAAAIRNWGRGRHDLATAAQNIGGKYGYGDAGKKVSDALNKRGMGSISNNTLARAGAAALGAGLAGAAGYNAYRAATTKRAAKKAAEFRSEMNKTFAGTEFGKKSGSQKKRRRR